jgi:hypothetical protein
MIEQSSVDFTRAMVIEENNKDIISEHHHHHDLST